MIYEVIIEGKNHRLELNRVAGVFDCKLDGRDIKLDAVLSRPDVLSILIEGKSYEIKRERTVTDMHLWVGPLRYAVEVRDPRSLRGRKSSVGDEQGIKKLVAAMPGKVVRVLVAEKAEVEVGQGILVVEAMKMQNEMKSPKKGVVIKILAKEGAAVNAGDVLAVVE